MAPGEFEEFAAVGQAAAEGAAEVEGGAWAGNGAAGAAAADVPGEAGDHLAGFGDFWGGELGEVFLAQYFAGAVGAGEVYVGRGVVGGVGGVGGWVVGGGVGAGGYLGFAVAALFAHGAQVHAALGVAGFAPEYLEGFVEFGEVLMAVDEYGAGGLVEFVAASDLDVFGGAD